MTFPRFFSQALALAMFLPSALIADEPNPGQVAISVGRLLEQGHYSRQELNDALSKRLLQNYLETLDYNHLFFTQQDINEFNTKYAAALDDDILLGNPSPALDIFSIYRERVESRVAKINELLKDEKFDFKSDHTIDLNRQKLPWPKDIDEADHLWHDRVEGELLQAKLNEHAVDPPAKVVKRRFDQVLRSVREQSADDIVATFLSALAQTYDPHSEYLGKSDLENFGISMKLSLVGIGAVLKSEDGYAKIVDLVPGGPAEKGGRLHVGDRITSVGQGKSELVETVDMKLDKVVQMIRGKKGTTVRLQIIPATSTDPSKQKLIEIVRDNIQLKDQEAKAEIIERNVDGGVAERIGWITLPSFYADMEHMGSKNAKSTTRDVEALLGRLEKEGISGLVVDLRRNGGGSLDEAIRLTGLFIKKGPVVQSKDSNGNIRVQSDDDSSIAYSGPMVVLTNRLSASASEIFAAALQDYGRAVIVGDGSTFGKGTVQTMLEIGRFLPFLGGDNNGAGALKLTIQKFYRIAGGSTQLRGVQSDVVVPSVFDQPEIGESALKEPLKYDEVPVARFDKFSTAALPIEELKSRSAARVSSEPEFQYVLEDLNRVKEKLERNTISLNEEKRRAEQSGDKTRREKQIAERKKRGEPQMKVYVVTLDDVSKPKLQAVSYSESLAKRHTAATRDEDGDEEDPGPLIDPVRNEAINIVADLIDLGRAPKTASVAK